MFNSKSLAMLVSTSFCFIVIIGFQNCAQPIGDIGMNSSLGAKCIIATSHDNVSLNQKLTINFNYSPAYLRAQLVIMNDGTGAFTDHYVTEPGNFDVTYTKTNQAGDYTVHGFLFDEFGTRVGQCARSYKVLGGTEPPPPPPTQTYVWHKSAWGTCSANACGSTGTQTRTVYCKRQSDNQKVNDSNCSGAKPLTSQNCSASACSYTYSWYTSPWSGCSASGCNISGTKTREVYCKRSDGSKVSDSSCSGTKPPNSENCTSMNCTYSWVTGNWGACSATACGQTGTQTRSVNCRRSDGTNVGANNCSSSKPDSSKNCTKSGCGGGGGGGGGGHPGPPSQVE